MIRKAMEGELRNLQAVKKRREERMSAKKQGADPQLTRKSGAMSGLTYLPKVEFSVTLSNSMERKEGAV